MTYKDKYLQWLSFADEDTKDELESITDDKEIEDRFERYYGRRLKQNEPLHCW